jgi:REP element-mobilizing transposase RayT
MEDEKIYYRRNLPHYQPSHASYFITFRLAGSLPNEVIIKLKEEYELEEQRLIAINEPDTKRTAIEEHRKRYFDRFDDFLDKYSDSHKWLSDDRVAQVVADAIHFRDTKEYELIAYCIMPNHVHMVADVERSGTSLYRVLQSLKAYTARECNKILNRSGAFWQHESYDHVIRNGKELANIISYVLNNPVKAEFVDDWQKWKWSYCKYEM